MATACRPMTKAVGAPAVAAQSVTVELAIGAPAPRTLAVDAIGSKTPPSKNKTEYGKCSARQFNAESFVIHLFSPRQSSMQ